MHKYIYDVFVIFVLAKATTPHIAPVVTAPSTVQVNYYMDARLECHVTGFPTPSIIWSFNDVTINIQLDIITFLYCMNNIDGVIVVYNLMNISSAISRRNKIHLYEMMMRFASFNISYHHYLKIVGIINYDHICKKKVEIFTERKF